MNLLSLQEASVPLLALKLLHLSLLHSSTSITSLSLNLLLPYQASLPSQLRAPVPILRIFHLEGLRLIHFLHLILQPAIPLLVLQASHSWQVVEEVSINFSSQITLSLRRQASTLAVPLSLVSTSSVRITRQAVSTICSAEAVQPPLKTHRLHNSLICSLDL